MATIAIGGRNPPRRVLINTATRADFIFETNAFGLDRDRMGAISMEHLAQPSREIGLA